jgi:hypothetical protein
MGVVKDARTGLGPALLSAIMLAPSCVAQVSSAASVEGILVASGTMVQDDSASGSVSPVSAGTADVIITAIFGPGQGVSLEATLPAGSRNDAPLTGLGVSLCDLNGKNCDDAPEGSVTFDVGGSTSVANFTITKSTMFTGRIGVGEAAAQGCQPIE